VNLVFVRKRCCIWAVVAKEILCLEKKGLLFFEKKSADGRKTFIVLRWGFRNGRLVDFRRGHFCGLDRSGKWGQIDRNCFKVGGRKINLKTDYAGERDWTWTFSV
jgi:hypothetical protein